MTRPSARVNECCSVIRWNHLCPPQRAGEVTNTAVSSLNARAGFGSTEPVHEREKKKTTKTTNGDRREKMNGLERWRGGGLCSLQVDTPQVSRRGDGVALRAQLLVPLWWTESQWLARLLGKSSSLSVVAESLIKWDRSKSKIKGVTSSQLTSFTVFWLNRHFMETWLVSYLRTEKSLVADLKSPLLWWRADEVTQEAPR